MRGLRELNCCSRWDLEATSEQIFKDPVLQSHFLAYKPPAPRLLVLLLQSSVCCSCCSSTLPSGETCCVCLAWVLLLSASLGALFYAFLYLLMGFSFSQQSGMGSDCY